MSNKTAAFSNNEPGEAGKRILRNGSMNLAAQLLYAALQLVAVIVLARDLGRDGIGHYYTMIALVLIVQLLVESGMGTLLTQRIAQSPDSWRQRVAEATGLFTLISVVSTLLILIVCGGWTLFEGAVDRIPAVVAASIACGAMQIQRFGFGVLQAFDLFVHENITKILQGLLFICALLLLVAFDATNINTVMAALALSHVSASAFVLARVDTYCSGIRWQLNTRLACEWLRASLPLGWGDVLRKVAWQLDTLMLAVLLSPAQVGTYSVAYRPLGPLNWLPRAVLSAAFPTVARQAGTDREMVRRAFARSTRLLVIIGLPLAICLFIAAEPLILHLAGDSFAESAGLLRVLIWVIVASFISLQFRYFLAATELHRYFAGMIGIMLGIKVALLSLLIPSYGCYGACFASLLAESIFTSMGLLFCIKSGIAHVEWPQVRRAVVAACLMGAFASHGQQSDIVFLILWLAMAGSVYLLLCLGLGVFRPEEIDVVKRIATRLRRRLQMASLRFLGNRSL